jgi:hypothetical protein
MVLAVKMAGIDQCQSQQKLNDEARSEKKRDRTLGEKF